MCGLSAPTLVLVAEHFRQTPGQGRKMSGLIPDLGFKVLEGAGHMLNWDNGEQFNREVLAFLEHCEAMGSWTAGTTER